MLLDQVRSRRTKLPESRRLADRTKERAPPFASVILLALPDLEDLATAGLGTELGGAGLAGRSEAHFIAI